MIRFEDVSKAYLKGQSALQGVSFKIESQEMVYLTGHSGAGKTTIMRLIAAQERVSLGNIYFDNKLITDISKEKIPFLRRKIGMIFLDHHLMLNKTVAENIALPLLIEGISVSQINERIHEVIEKVGLKGKGNSYPLALSTGEQQRVGIARAIIGKPKLLLADEPTGNLDRRLSLDILELFNELNDEGMTIIMATHDIDLISHYPKRTIRLKSGNIICDGMFNPEDYDV